MEVAELIAAEIRDTGPIPFSRYMELALYHPEAGFYSSGGRAGGRRGDFVTSVETGPLFAALVAERFDRHWLDLGRPNPYRVAELGAGVGTLWRGIVKAEPDCLGALEWCLVEQSGPQRATHGSLPGTGWSSAVALPPGDWHGVFANELLDNLAFDIAEFDGNDWVELRVDYDGGDFAWIRGAPLMAPPVQSPTTDLRVPILNQAVTVVHACIDVSELVVMVDYGATTSELAARGGWLRTYAGHERGADPFREPGARDITADVAFDQLPIPTKTLGQAAWLQSLGVAQRVLHARETWAERGHLGDLEALFARSAITEAEALTDPTGLGAFSVLEWHREPGHDRT